jgi:hypothetical protein
MRGVSCGNKRSYGNEPGVVAFIKGVEAKGDKRED